MSEEYKRGRFRARFLVLGMTVVLCFAANVEAAFEQAPFNSCIECHSGLSDKRLSQPVALWGKSVHAEVGNTCDGCHGGDPKDKTVNAMSKSNNFYAAPMEEEIPSFCGKCHQELADNFMTSAHGQTGAPTCIDCHGIHTIHRISIDIISEEKCSECHDYQKPEKLKSILQGLHNHFHALKDMVGQVSGFPTRPIQKDLDKVWKKLRQVRMISHTFDLTQIQAESKKVEELLDTTDSKIQNLLSMVEDRHSLGYWMVIIFTLLAVLTYFYNKQIKKL